jgi:hypothetical protein
MKRLVSASIVTIGLSTPALSQSPISFQGTGIIIGLEGPGCATSGIEVGEDFVSAYWPKGNGNTFPSAFSFVFRRSAVSFESNSGGGRLATGGFLAASGVGHRGPSFEYNPKYSNFTIVPPENNITELTEFVDVEGTVVRYNNIPDCDLTFRAGYARRP